MVAAGGRGCGAEMSVKVDIVMHVMDHCDPSISVLLRAGRSGAAFQSTAAQAMWCGREQAGRGREHGKWLVVCGNAFDVAVLPRVGCEKPPPIPDFFSMLTIFLAGSFFMRSHGVMLCVYFLFFSEPEKQEKRKNKRESVWVSRDSLYFFLCGGRLQVGAAVGTL